MKQQPEPDNKPVQQPHHINSICVGSISLDSNCLSLDELIARAKRILQDATFKEHLNQIKVLGNDKTPASYTG